MARRISRRTFLKRSAALSASSILGVSVLSRCSRISRPPADITVVKGADYFVNTVKAVEHLGGMGRFVQTGSRVAVLANPQRNNPGAYTKPEIVRAVIRMCGQAGAGAVSCLSWQPEQNWENTGIKSVVEEEGASLIIVDRKDETLFEPVPVPGGVSLEEARIMKPLFDCDVLIDVPITKDHAGNRFTGTMKNLMGLNRSFRDRAFLIT